MKVRTLKKGMIHVHPKEILRTHMLMGLRSHLNRMYSDHLMEMMNRLEDPGLLALIPSFYVGASTTGLHN